MHAIITFDSSAEEVQTWNNCWIRDGQVLQLVCLSASARAQLPGAGRAQLPRRTARSVYKEIPHLFGGADFSTAAVIRDKLIALQCAPSRINDYVCLWRTGLNRLEFSGRPFDHPGSLRHFVKHLPFRSTYDIIRESVLFHLSTAGLQRYFPPSSQSLKTL